MFASPHLQAWLSFLQTGPIGVPPLAGFIGKLYVFVAAAEEGL